jgi:3-oxoacyl-[acyl-carrier protein] reductase
MELNLKDKNILVTGASRGIGAAIARALGQAGARVVVHYSRSKNKAEALANEAGNGSFTIQAELSEPEQVGQLFGQAVSRVGTLHGLVNNAGIAIRSDISSADSAWISEFEQTLAVNLKATALLCKKAINHFLEKGGGRIVNVSSRAAFRGDTADYMAYAASKGGMVALTRSIARAYGKQGITAFDLAPGFTRTEMAEQFINEYGEDFARQGIALNELTTPENIAPMVVFLQCGMADHATGCTFDMNAGSYVH